MSSTISLFRKYSFELLCLSPTFFYLVGFLFIILFYLIKISFTYVAPDFLSTFPSLRNYFSIASSHEFRVAFLNTLVFVIVGTPLELLTGLFFALLVNRSFPGQGFVRSLFTVPLAVPALVTAIILFILFDFPAGHINNLLLGKHIIFPKLIDTPISWRTSEFFALGTAMIGKVWRDMPISMLILLAGLSSISQDQYEAAETMGAGLVQKFRFITLPLLVPAISSVLVLRSIEMWKEFIFPFILAGQWPLLGTFIESLFHNWHKPQEAAVVALMLVLCIVFSTFFVFYVLRFVRKNLVRI